MLLRFTRRNVLHKEKCIIFSIRNSIFIIYQQKVAQTIALFYGMITFIYLYIYLEFLRNPLQMKLVLK